MQRATWKLRSWLSVSKQRDYQKGGWSRVLINQNPCPVELVFLGGCWTRHNIWLCLQPRLPRCSLASPQGAGPHRAQGCFPLTSERAAGPEEAEGTRSGASVHISCQEWWPQVEQLPEGLSVSSGRKLNLKQRGPVYLHCES